LEIQKENIKIFVTSNGSVLIGQYDYEENNIIVLKYPFRVIPMQGGIQVGSILSDEETWVKIEKSGTMEMEVGKKMEDTYVKYCNKIFGSGLVLPAEKRIII
jgi:hypothetical protein